MQDESTAEKAFVDLSDKIAVMLKDLKVPRDLFYPMERFALKLENVYLPTRGWNLAFRITLVDGTAPWQENNRTTNIDIPNDNLQESFFKELEKHLQ